MHTNRDSSKKSQVAKVVTKNKLGRRKKLLQKALDLIKNKKSLKIEPEIIQDFVVKKSVHKNDNDIVTTINLKVNESFGLWATHYEKSGKVAVLFGYDPSNPNKKPFFVL